MAAPQRCRSCGAPIRWVATKNGKKMPIEERRLTVVTDAGEVVTGHEPHWAHCPNAAKHRKAKG